jgi:hypothetical protein
MATFEKKHYPSVNATRIEIRDSVGHLVVLSPSEAYDLLEWLDSQRGDLFALLHPEISEPQKVPLYDDIPDFTESEALLLVEALNGVRCTPGTLHGNISRDIASGGASRYSVDGPVFLACIDALSKVQAQAVIDAVALFWHGVPHSKSDEETYAVLYRIGLVKQESRP